MLVFTFKNDSGAILGIFNGQASYLLPKIPHRMLDEEVTEIIYDLACFGSDTKSDSLNIREVFVHEEAHRDIFEMSNTGKMLLALRNVSRFLFITFRSQKFVEFYYEKRTIYFVKFYDFHEFYVDLTLKKRAKNKHFYKNEIKEKTEEIDNKVLNQWNLQWSVHFLLKLYIFLTSKKTNDMAYSISPTHDYDKTRSRRDRVQSYKRVNKFCDILHRETIGKYYKRKEDYLCLLRWFYYGQLKQLKISLVSINEYRDKFMTPCCEFVFTWSKIEHGDQAILYELVEDVFELDEESFFSKWTPLIIEGKSLNHAFIRFVNFFYYSHN